MAAASAEGLRRRMAERESERLRELMRSKAAADRTRREQLLALDGFARTGRPPDHIIMSRGVDVSVFPLEQEIAP